MENNEASLVIINGVFDRLDLLAAKIGTSAPEILSVFSNHVFIKAVAAVLAVVIVYILILVIAKKIVTLWGNDSDAQIGVLIVITIIAAIGMCIAVPNIPNILVPEKQALIQITHEVSRLTP